MKKIIIFALTISLILFAACTNQPQGDASGQDTSVYFTEREPEYWPEGDPCPEGGFLIDEEYGTPMFNRFRNLYYSLFYPLTALAGDDVAVREWERTRSSEDYHNIAAVVSFVQDFNISREDFDRANEQLRQTFRGAAPEENSGNELYPVDLIFSFDNERINEFFRWENSIYAHEVGLENPLRGEWVICDEYGFRRFVDHPNWTENPGWRDHPFWDYLPFNPANMTEGSPE